MNDSDGDAGCDAQIVHTSPWKQTIEIDLHKAVDAIEQLPGAHAESEALRLFRAASTSLGAKHAFFAAFVGEPERMPACRFMLACEPTWCQTYAETEAIRSDPWLRYAAGHSRPALAADIVPRSAEQRAVVDLLARNGFASAVLVPTHSDSDRHHSLLCLGSSNQRSFEGAQWSRLLIGARMLALALHDRWLAQLGQRLIREARLTQDDLILLAHEIHGHTSKEIAARQLRSHIAVNSCFQRLNTRLGTATRRVAAELARDCGLLDRVRLPTRPGHRLEQAQGSSNEAGQG